MSSHGQQTNIRTSPLSFSKQESLGAVFTVFVVGGGLYFLSGSIVVAGIIFAAFLGWMGWKTYKWQVYGPSHLQLETAPVPLGESLRARLRAPVSADDQPPNGFQVRVAATQGSGEDKETVWEEWTSVRGQPGAVETEVPLSLDLPAQPLPDDQRYMAENKPWGSVQNTLEKMDWTLEVTASFDDKIDYEVSFDLPVSVPDNLDERADDSSTDASDEDEVYWSVNEDGGEADLRRADSETDASDNEE